MRDASTQVECTPRTQVLLGSCDVARPWAVVVSADGVLSLTRIEFLRSLLLLPVIQERHRTLAAIMR